MSLKHVDLESAMRRVAERRIEDAMREGKFDNLPGKGQPLELEPIPADENARLTWWALKILRQNDVIPDEVRWRKTIDLLRQHLDQARTEAGVRTAVAQINALVSKINTMGTTAFMQPLAPVCEDEQLRLLRSRSEGAQRDLRPPPQRSPARLSSAKSGVPGEGEEGHARTRLPSSS